MKKSLQHFRHFKLLRQTDLGVLLLNSSHLASKGKLSTFRRFLHTPADDPNFLSIVDNPPTLVKVGRRHGPGIIFLGYLSNSLAKSGH